MTALALGRYATPQHVEGPTFFGSDAFGEPACGVFGVASSFHHYHLAPISERDVQAAFSILRAELAERNTARLPSSELLQRLLRAVHQGFVKTDIYAHIDGIEFEPVSLPGLPEPAEDPESEPLVYVVLLRLQGRRLTIASVGNFLVYVMRQTELKLVFGWDWYSGIRTGGVSDFPGPCVRAYHDFPTTYSWEMQVARGDLVIASTHSLGEIIALAELEQSAYPPAGDPEAIARRLMTTLKSVCPEGRVDLGEPHATTKSLVGEWGAAWAIARVDA